MSKYVIRYTYPGTSNGQPVGEVYVLAGRDFGTPINDVYSYAKDPAQATKWPTEQAALAEAYGKRWPNAQILPLHFARESVFTFRTPGDPDKWETAGPWTEKP